MPETVLCDLARLHLKVNKWDQDNGSAVPIDVIIDGPGEDKIGLISAGLSEKILFNRFYVPYLILH